MTTFRERGREGSIKGTVSFGVAGTGDSTEVKNSLSTADASEASCDNLPDLSYISVGRQLVLHLPINRLDSLKKAVESLVNVSLKKDLFALRIRLWT